MKRCAGGWFDLWRLLRCPICQTIHHFHGSAAGTEVCEILVLVVVGSYHFFGDCNIYVFFF